MKKSYTFFKFLSLSLFFLLVFVLNSCSKDNSVDTNTQVDPEPNPNPKPELTSKVYTVDNITDTYFDVAGVANVKDWKVHIMFMILR
ncbi:hypothetical protein [Thalassobellus suaedae]|uniref:Uncharacterized protein n=1 Tax=Thalassobellus suaedae TaxID=3074124 RepID=A0ABY9XU91_9FLAO|nr:hypothetical protein RHP51_00130 [Flavobacteriaceae bacterium HL-DH14]